MAAVINKADYGCLLSNHFVMNLSPDHCSSCLQQAGAWMSTSPPAINGSLKGNRTSPHLKCVCVLPLIVNNKPPQSVITTRCGKARQRRCFITVAAGAAVAGGSPRRPQHHAGGAGGTGRGGSCVVGSRSCAHVRPWTLAFCTSGFGVCCGILNQYNIMQQYCRLKEDNANHAWL